MTDQRFGGFRKAFWSSFWWRGPDVYCFAAGWTVNCAPRKLTPRAVPEMRLPRRLLSAHSRSRSRVVDANAVSSSASNCWPVIELRRQIASRRAGHALALTARVSAGSCCPSCTQGPWFTIPAGTLRAPRSHVAGHRAPTYVSNRPHVPAFTRECACQLRTGGCS